MLWEILISMPSSTSGGNSTVAGVQFCKHRLLANTAGNAVAVIRDRLATSPVDYIMYCTHCKYLEQLA